MTERSAMLSTPVAVPGLLAARQRIQRRQMWLLVTGAIGVLGVTLLAGVALGSVAIPLPDVIGVVLHRLGLPIAVDWPPTTATIVLELRIPRVLTAMAVGVALSLAGATFQGLLRNPLADPYVLGTASGAALGAAVGLVLPVPFVLLGLGLTQLLAFAGALAAVTVVYRLAHAGGSSSMTAVLLTGYAVGSLLAAGLALTMYLSGSALRQIFFYLLGSFSLASWPQLIVSLPIMAAGSALILLRGRTLNGLLLGDETAGHLGISVRRERIMLLALATLVTAAAVAVSGLIGFVGLVVPHLVRLVVGPNARLLLPLSALAGASFLGLADVLARIPGEIPVGIVTGLVGAPFFVYLLRRYRTGYEL